MTKYGHVTANTHCGKVVVSLNGLDVTDRCTEAHDVEGWVRLMCVDDKWHSAESVPGGGAHLAPGSLDVVCTHVVGGDVRIASRP